jgi:hypothetical protein
MSLQQLSVQAALTKIFLFLTAGHLIRLAFCKKTTFRA